MEKIVWCRYSIATFTNILVLDSTYLPLHIFFISGLSVDMAVFRDLMKLRLPGLSKHLDDLQNDANEGCNRKFPYP